MNVRGAAQAGTAVLVLLLAADVLNGCYALATGEPATAAALAVKAAIALALAVRIAWSGPVLLAAFVPLACAAFYFATRADALLTSNTEAALLLLKTGGTTLLLALVAARRQTMAEEAVARYLRGVLLVIAASLALGLAGIGHDRYGDEDAFLSANGFMPAGNELNLALAVLFWWLSARRRHRSATAPDRALYWLCLLLMGVSGSKTTIAGALVTVLWFHRDRPWHLAAIALGTVLAFRALVAAAIWDRWLFFFTIHLEEGPLSALTNGRFGRAADALAAWWTLPPQGTAFLAGNGYVESDPVDLLLNFGVGGAALYGCFALVLWRACGGRLLPWLLVLAASALAGHVVYSAFAAPVLACALAPLPEAAARRSWPRAQQPVGRAA